MKKPRLLLATTDHELKRLLTFLCSKVGAEPLAASSGPEALRKAESLLPELIVLDAMSGDGFAVCRRLRGIAAFLDTPILLLVERAEAKYQAFQAGATDVMQKPLDQLEFQYRLQVQMRARTRRLEVAPVISAGRLTLDPTGAVAALGDQSVQLTPSEFAILSFLAARPAAAVSTEELLVGALGEPAQLGNPQVVHTHMRNLRKKIASLPAEPPLISSSRRGYTFQPPN